MRLVRVAVPVPALDALTYRVPEDLNEPAAGARVLVPLGKRTVTGVILDSPSPEPPSPEPPSPELLSSEVASPEPPGPEFPQRSSIKDIIDVLDSEPFLNADVVTLVSWVSEYYACGIGEAIAAAMPPRAWIVSERFAQLAEGVNGRIEAERGPRRQILEALTARKPVRIDRLAKLGTGIHAAVLALERDGLIVLTQPLKGSADAHRTVRTVRLTAQGHDDEVIAGIFRARAKAASIGRRQREAIEILRAAPAGIDATDLKGRGI
jgi:primosomal protein N'